jgi:hypothetical protein
VRRSDGRLLIPNSNMAEFKINLPTTCPVYGIRQASLEHTLPRYAFQAEDPFKHKESVSFVWEAEESGSAPGGTGADRYHPKVIELALQWGAF